eukprot:g82692.t1
MVVFPWWVQVLLLLSSLWCCVLNRVVRKAMRWIWVIAKIEAEEEMGAWVHSLPPSEGLCLVVALVGFQGKVELQCFAPHTTHVWFQRGRGRNIRFFGCLEGDVRFRPGKREVLPLWDGVLEP